MQEVLWFVSRAFGLVALVMLTLTAVLGGAHATRTSGGGWPRFTLHAVHRNLSLLTLVFVVVHIASAIVDGYVDLTWIDAVVPFGSGYHPFWVGLGAVGLDLLLAVLVTSLLRTRLSARVWRGVHLSSYALWPVAMLHGWGIGGADSRLTWVLAIDVLCVAVVAAAVVRRLLVRRPDAVARRPVDAR